MDPQYEQQLYILRAELKRVQKAARIAGQMVARLIEATETQDDSPKEGTRNDSTKEANYRR